MDVLYFPKSLWRLKKVMEKENSNKVTEIKIQKTKYQTSKLHTVTLLGRTSQII